jgi:hypothetical protein
MADDKKNPKGDLRIGDDWTIEFNDPPDAENNSDVLMGPEAGAEPVEAGDTEEVFPDDPTEPAIPSRLHPYKEAPKRAPHHMPDDKNMKTTEHEPAIKEALEEIKRTLPEAPISARSKWIAGVIITIMGSLAYPTGAAVSTYTKEKAREEKAIASKKADALSQQRRMQADLLKRIIAVAEKATVKNPNSVLQLGLIAKMVNENHSVFGIQLDQAERTLSDMSNRLAPLSGLRKRLAETNELISDIKKKFGQAKKHENDLLREKDELEVELKKTKWAARYRRSQLKKDIANKEQELAKHIVRRRFFEIQLKREQHYRRYFKRQLEHQSRKLQAALKDVADARDEAKDKTQEVNKLAARLAVASTDKRSMQSLLDKLRAKLKEITDDHKQNQQTVKRVSSELKSERKELALLRAKYQTLVSACAIEKKDRKSQSATAGGGGGGGGGGAAGIGGTSRTITPKPRARTPEAAPRYRPRARAAPRPSPPRAAPHPRKRRYMMDGLVGD